MTYDEPSLVGEPLGCPHWWVERDKYWDPTEWDDSFVSMYPYPVTYFKGWSSKLVICARCAETGYFLQEVS